MSMMRGRGTACDMNIRGGDGRINQNCVGVGNLKKIKLFVGCAPGISFFLGKYHFWVFIPEMRLKKSKTDSIHKNTVCFA